jgi:hypothetical protein
MNNSPSKNYMAGSLKINQFSSQGPNDFLRNSEVYNRSISGSAYPISN